MKSIQMVTVVSKVPLPNTFKLEPNYCNFGFLT